MAMYQNLDLNPTYEKDKCKEYNIGGSLFVGVNSWAIHVFFFLIDGAPVASISTKLRDDFDTGVSTGFISITTFDKCKEGTWSMDLTVVQRRWLIDNKMFVLILKRVETMNLKCE